MKSPSVLSAAVAAAFALLAAVPIRAADASVRYREIREAAAAVVGDFARSGAIPAGDVPAVRVKSVVNNSRLRPDSDRIEGMLRKELSVYRAVTVAGDADPADLVLAPEIRVDEDGAFVLSASVSNAGTGESVWNGSSRFGEPQADASENAPVPVAETPAAKPSVAAAPVAKPPVAAAPAAKPPVAAAPVAAAPVAEDPVPAPIFLEGAAKTWDEWFARGIKSVGYHPAGYVESAPVESEPEEEVGGEAERGFMGRTCFEAFGRYEFVDKHDFHKCHHGKGGNGFACGGAELRLNVWEGLDLSLSGGWGQNVFLSDETLDADYYDVKDGDIDLWFAEARAQWSFLPGEVLNPYIGAGVEYTKAKGTIESDTYYYDTYEWNGYGWRRERHAVSMKYEDKSSATCGLLNAGLEVNLGSRLSLRGDFTYYAESHGDESVWADCSRKVFSVDARIRFVDGLYLMLGGSLQRTDYDEDGKTKMLRGGLGWRF